MQSREIASGAERILNSEQCPFCHKSHRVAITVAGTDIRPVVTWGFPDGACDEYRQYVSNYLHHLYKLNGYHI